MAPAPPKPIIIRAQVPGSGTLKTPCPLATKLFKPEFALAPKPGFTDRRLKEYSFFEVGPHPVQERATCVREGPGQAPTRALLWS